MRRDKVFHSICEVATTAEDWPIGTTAASNALPSARCTVRRSEMPSVLSKAALSLKTFPEKMSLYALGGRICTEANNAIQSVPCIAVRRSSVTCERASQGLRVVNGNYDCIDLSSELTNSCR